MSQFIEKKFNIPELKGISKKNIEEHLGLYSGYVKNANTVLSKITELSADTEKNIYLIGELGRRFSFEYNGIRNHELYFSQLDGGAIAPNTDSNIYKKISLDFGSFENWLVKFKTLAMTRGIGWGMLYHDKETDILMNTWVDEQHLGQLQGLTPILALDMWEHSYVADYNPSGKKKYIEDYLSNINWKVIENRF